MALFGISQSEFISLLKGGDFTKLYRALKRGMEEFDYKSGWVAKPSDGTFKHNLKVTPKVVHVLGSDTQDGETYTPELATSVSKETIVVGGSKAYYNVLAQR